jgi:hypothetical protein
MATIAARGSREESFYQKMAVALAGFILFSFGQFAARGMVDYRHAPLIVHAHAAAMLLWLGLLVIQSTLAQRLQLAQHRRIGWTGLALALAIPPLAVATCVTMMRGHAIPPFFTPAFLLSLVVTEGLTFGGLVICALLLRRRTEWHRRLMIGATIVLLEPALGRILPMPLLGGWGEWLAMALQLAVAGVLVRHDVGARGRVHEATLVVVVAIIFTHVVDVLLAMAPPIVALAGSLAA